MVVSQGEVWWADLAEPVGSEPGYARPVLVVQSDWINASAIGTVLCIPLTGNAKWVNAPGNVFLSARETGLDRDSVGNVSQLTAIGRRKLRDRMGRVSRTTLGKVFTGIDTVLGR